MRDIFQNIDKSNLYESIHKQIALALIEGRLRPNDKVRIRAIADQLGVSVTPVRDALLRLVREGALEMRGHKDLRVPEMTERQYDEIRLIRLRLEGLAASLAAENMNAEAEADLRDILQRNELARSAGNAAEAIRLNRLFHFRIAEYSRLPKLVEMIDNFWLLMGPLIAAVYNTGGQVMISYHHEIMKALGERNGEAAEIAIRADINATAEVLRTSGLLRRGEVDVDLPLPVPGGLPV